MVRLVFRPYAQVGRTICTSVPRRTSTRVSPGFILLRHSSPSFGSYWTCSASRLPASGRPGGGDAPEGEYHLESKTFFTFISLRGLTPFNSHAQKTPRSVFQDGRMTTISSEISNTTQPKLLKDGWSLRIV